MATAIVLVIQLRTVKNFLGDRSWLLWSLLLSLLIEHLLCFDILGFDVELAITSTAVRTYWLLDLVFGLYFFYVQYGILIFVERSRSDLNYGRLLLFGALI